MLSAKKVERVKAKGRYADGTLPGLYLQVSASGAKSWLLRYEIGGRKRWMGLGPASVFSLKEARERARRPARRSPTRSIRWSCAAPNGSSRPRPAHGIHVPRGGGALLRSQ